MTSYITITRAERQAARNQDEIALLILERAKKLGWNLSGPWTYYEVVGTGEHIYQQEIEDGPALLRKP